jgi:hypothetical protein
MVCPRCKSTFPVQRTAPANWADSLTDCPDCGYSSFTAERFDVCPKCGLVGRDYHERIRQRPLPRQSGSTSPAQGGEGGDFIRRELERLERDEKNRERQRAESLGVPLRDELEAPPAPPTVPDVVKYSAGVCILAGLVLIASGCYGLYSYHMFVPAEPDAILNEEPPGAFMVYCAQGLSPTLQALLGVYAVIAGVMFLKMHPRSRKVIEAAAWGGLAYAVGAQIADLAGWFRRSSGVPSFFYYFTGIMNALLMSAIWSAPLLAALWFLRGEAIDKAFEE